MVQSWHVFYSSLSSDDELSLCTGARNFWSSMTLEVETCSFPTGGESGNGLGVAVWSVLSFQDGTCRLYRESFDTKRYQKFVDSQMWQTNSYLGCYESRLFSKIIVLFPLKTAETTILVCERGIKNRVMAPKTHFLCLAFPASAGLVNRPPAWPSTPMTSCWAKLPSRPGYFMIFPCFCKGKQRTTWGPFPPCLSSSFLLKLQSKAAVGAPIAPGATSASFFLVDFSGFSQKTWPSNGGFLK